MRNILLWDTSHPAMREVAEAFARDGDAVYCVGAAVEGARAVPATLAPLSDMALDLLVLGLPPMEGIGEGAPRDYDALLTAIEQALLGADACVDAALPLLRAGGRRIAVLSAPQASIAIGGDGTNHAERIASAALNMRQKIWFNALRPEGFTFRNYCRRNPPGAGISEKEYFTRGLCYDEKEPYSHSDENRLVMRDSMRIEVPW